MTKMCKWCKTEKSVGEFYVSGERNGKIYYSSRCKECEREKARKYVREHRSERVRYMKDYVTRNPDKLWLYRRRADLKSKYGITIEEYGRMFAEQDGACAICKEKWEFGTRIMAVDHNHTTNAIRGLLCDRCNRGLGYLRDNQEILVRATQYLNQ